MKLIPLFCVSLVLLSSCTREHPSENISRAKSPVQLSSTGIASLSGTITETKPQICYIDSSKTEKTLKSVQKKCKPTDIVFDLDGGFP